MPEKTATPTEQLLEDFDSWSKRCEESEYTDTGVAWNFLTALAAALRSTLPAIAELEAALGLPEEHGDTIGALQQAAEGVVAASRH